MDPGEAKECGITVRRSPDAAEETVISYNAATQDVVLSGAHSSLSPEAIGGTYRTPLSLQSGELLRLTVFLDASVVEVFANGRHA